MLQVNFSNPPQRQLDGLMDTVITLFFATCCYINNESFAVYFSYKNSYIVSYFKNSKTIKITLHKWLRKLVDYIFTICIIVESHRSISVWLYFSTLLLTIPILFHQYELKINFVNTNSVENWCEKLDNLLSLVFNDKLLFIWCYKLQLNQFKYCLSYFLKYFNLLNSQYD